jgi:hypothetical protein
VASALIGGVGLLVFNSMYLFDGTGEASSAEMAMTVDYVPPAAQCGRLSKVGDEVSVTFEGTIDASSSAGVAGTVFDATSAHDGPFSFTLGDRKVLPGWERGLAQMCVGEKRTLVLPPALGYGHLGSRDGAVPGGATLRFEITLVHIWRKGSGDEILAAASGAAAPAAPAAPAAAAVVSIAARSEVAVAVHDAHTEALARTVEEHDGATRVMKAAAVVMETTPAALALTAKLQAATRALLRARYAPFITAAGTVIVDFSLHFPDAMPDAAHFPGVQHIAIETAPIALMPHAVFTFLEVVRLWKGGVFHRNAGHVLQAQTVGSGAKGLAFQEYSPQYPHVENTLGFAGRPGELCFIYRYILRESCSQFDSLPLTSLMIPQAVRPSTCASLCPWWTLGSAPSDARIVGRRTASPAHATTNRPHSSSPILSLPRAPRFPLIAPSSSIIDNTRNHGPASQGSKSEADSCFGKIREGQSQVERMKRVWTGTNFPAMDKMGFTNKAEDHIRIEAVTLRAA